MPQVYETAGLWYAGTVDPPVALVQSDQQPAYNAGEAGLVASELSRRLATLSEKLPRRHATQARAADVDLHETPVETPPEAVFFF